MANNKLNELTERLFNEGLAKGQQEGERILAEARTEAGQILDDARRTAESIIAEAEKKAADIAAKSASDVKMASSQAIAATKADIQNAVMAKVVDTKVAAALADEAFIKEVILAAAKSLGTDADLAMVLPENTPAKLEAYAAKEVATAIGKGIEVTLSKKVKGGLTVGPKDGGWFIDLSDETFSSLIREYLRPATRKILFGE